MISPPLIKLCALDDVPVGEIRPGVLPDGSKVAIYNVEGRIHVTADECTHGASSLSEEGTLIGGIVECGFHFGRFDVATGQAKAMPCEVALKCYEVVIAGGEICIADPARLEDKT